MTLGQVHFSAALVALGAGAVTLLRRKGTSSHRRLGWVYVLSMIVLNVSALMIYRLTRTFGPFHVAAVVSLASLIAGVVPAWRKKPAKQWYDYHYFFMSYSYLGLVAAAFAETATRVPAIRSFSGGPTARFWIIVAGVSVAIFAIGSTLIRRGATRILPSFRRG